MALENPNDLRGHTRLTQMRYYRYPLYKRDGHFNTLHYARRLFQQYAVDSYAVIDQNNLRYLAQNQGKLRSDVYNAHTDALHANDHDSAEVGRRVILPSSHLGSDRSMQQLYMDSMAIVRHFGKPFLFITFTANPAWIEITRELKESQSTMDRPNLIARVFHMKQQSLIADVRQCFGAYNGEVSTIEYQKRGLPHMHLLLFLNHDDTFLNPERIDDVIITELPDADINSNGSLRAIIKRVMIHGPCGMLNPALSCMKTPKDGGEQTCSKRFPKEFQEITIANGDSYSEYRRKPPGPDESPWNMRIGNRDIFLDNRWVVLYNPYLSKKYQAYINVEVCASVKAIKYIHKYVYKGNDRATVAVEDRANEIKCYLSGRYIEPVEAVWHLFGFRNHNENPSITRLDVHEEGMKAYNFPETATPAERAAIRDNPSTLDAFFRYNQQNEEARDVLYSNFPNGHTFVAKTKYWKIRQRGFAIGRMYHCSPSSGERYYLRLLLTVVPGAQGYEHLRTVDGVVYPNYKAACLALGLFDDNNEWTSCFTEAKEFTSGQGLRQLFVNALIHGDLANPMALWNQFKANVCNDIPHLLRGRILPPQLENPHEDHGLHLRSKGLAEFDKTLTNFGLPEPVHDWRLEENRLIAAELAYDPVVEQRLFDEKFALLNDEQMHAFRRITEGIRNDPTTAHYFLNGPAGTGKTFLYCVLCHYFRTQRKIVLCIASSGVAALLLPGSRTSHSTLKIPIKIDENSTCYMPKDGILAELLKEVALIVWDEVPMQHKHCFGAVNRSLGDIRKNEEALFGGIPVLLGGDFAQTTPVVPRGSRALQVNASIRSWEFWDRIRVLRLVRNMRVMPGPANEEFSAWLGRLSYTPELRSNIRLPQHISQRFRDGKAFINQFFPPAELLDPTPDFFDSRAILTPRNDTAAEFNSEILHHLHPTAPVETFDSVDSSDANQDGGDHELSAEFIKAI